MPARPKKRFTEEDYQAFLAKAAGERDAISKDSTAAYPPAPKRKGSKKPAPAPAEASCAFPDLAQPKSPKKRQGVKEQPIMTSMRECSIAVEASPKHLSIAFFGARLFTLNEILAILQYRKYVVFGYKKLWHDLVRTALERLGDEKPRFDGPCRATFFRQGQNPVDRDSLSVMFKYILDALTDHPKKGMIGVFPDDNPEIIADDRKIQRKGDPIVAIRIDAISKRKTPPPPVSSLFEQPDPLPIPFSAKIRKPPAQPEAPEAAAPKKRSRKKMEPDRAP